MNCTVKLDLVGKRFTTTVDGKEGYLQFRQISPHIYDFNYIAVHEDLRGRGVASEILHNALLFAQKEHIQVIPGCDFVQTFLKKHPEFRCVTLEEAV